jgi:hypothetical protein
MYRRALLALALFSIAHAARAESGLASYYGGRGHRGEMTCAHRPGLWEHRHDDARQPFKTEPCQ